MEDVANEVIKKHIKEGQKDTMAHMGDVLICVGFVETWLSHMITGYFIKGGESMNTFNEVFLSDRVMFGRKIEIFKEVCKKENLSNTPLYQRVIFLLNAMNGIRRQVAHAQGIYLTDYDNKEGFKLSVTHKKGTLVLSNAIMADLRKQQVEVMQGITELGLIIYKNKSSKKEPDVNVI